MVSARKALESLYADLCTVTVRGNKRTNPATKRTEFDELTAIQDQPCRISFERIPITGDGPAAALAQSVKLFLPPDIDVPPGSKISVTRDGGTTEYSRSGPPAYYPSHQEIPLEIWRDWA